MDSTLIICLSACFTHTQIHRQKMNKTQKRLTSTVLPTVACATVLHRWTIYTINIIYVADIIAPVEDACVVGVCRGRVCSELRRDAEGLQHAPNGAHEGRVGEVVRLDLAEGEVVDHGRERLHDGRIRRDKGAAEVHVAQRVLLADEEDQLREMGGDHLQHCSDDVVLSAVIIIIEQNR